MKNILLVAAATLALCGCGGGGGGGGEPAPVLLEMNQSRVTATTVPGQSVPVETSFSINRFPPGQPPYRGDLEPVAGDTGSALDPAITLSRNGEFNYYVAARSRGDLPLGRHRGALRVRLCEDDSCRKILADKQLPYDITVVSDGGSNLKPLVPFSGAGQWTAERRDARRNAYVPVTLDAARFSARWLRAAPDSTTQRVLPPVSDSATGMAYVVSGNFVLTGARLTAFRESDGTEVWSKSFASTEQVSAPAVAGNRLLIAVADDSGSRLLAYNALDGAQLYNRATPARIPGSPSAPAVSGETVFVSFGDESWMGKIAAFSLASGRPLWTSERGAFRGVPVSADGSEAYFYRPNRTTGGFAGPGLIVLDAATGAEVVSHAQPEGLPTEPQVTYVGRAPVPDGSGGVLVSSGFAFGGNVHLYRYGLEMRRPLWQLPLASQQLVVVGDTFYMIVPGVQVEARRLADGERLWSWSAPAIREAGPSYTDLIATQNLLFVGTDAAVYALDLATRAPVWTYPAGGSLSLSSSGLLYISREDRKLAAINLN